MSIEFIVLCCIKVSSTAMFLCIVYITLQNWNKFGCFFYSFFTQIKEKKISIACFSSDYVEKSTFFYVCSICLRNLLFKRKRIKKNVKQRAGFRWKCVLKSMFILLMSYICLFNIWHLTRTLTLSWHNGNMGSAHPLVKVNMSFKLEGNPSISKGVIERTRQNV